MGTSGGELDRRLGTPEQTAGDMRPRASGGLARVCQRDADLRKRESRLRIGRRARPGAGVHHRVVRGTPNPSVSARLRSAPMTKVAVPPLNPDYERRSFWGATMPALPDRSGRDLPAAADVVVIGGGYAGINAARELAARGVAVTLLEAHTLGWGASTRNGGIVHAGYKWSARELIKRYGAETGRALYQETLDSYQLVKRADRRASDRLRLPRGRATSSSPTRRRTSPSSSMRATSLASVGVTRDRRAARADPRGDRHATRTTARSWSRAAGCSIPAGTSPGWPPRPTAPAPTCTRASGHGRSAARPTVASSSRRRVAPSSPATCSSRRTATPTGWRRRCAAGSWASARSSSPREPLPEDAGPRALAEGPRRSSTRRTSCTTGTCRPIAGWSSAAGPRSCRPRSTRPPRILWQGLLEVHPQLADYRIEYAWGGNVGFTFDRMPHVGRTKDGVTYALGCCGTGVALMTDLGRASGRGWPVARRPP